MKANIRKDGIMDTVDYTWTMVSSMMATLLRDIFMDKEN